MKWKTFIIGWSLALAVLLFAQRHNPIQSPDHLASVIDLTRTSNSLALSTSATTIGAPAAFAAGRWTVDEIPAERLVGPLVVLDVGANAASRPGYRVSLADVAEWEQKNGHIPAGSIALARTGTRDAAWDPDTVRFLVEARSINGLGIDGGSIGGRAVDSPENAALYSYMAAHGVYQLANVGNLGRVPKAGAILVVAPAKMHEATGPARLLALVR